MARSRKKPKQVHHYVVIVRWGKKLLFQKRPPEGLWSNMWQLPTIESDQVRKLQDLAFAAPVSGLCQVGCFDHQTTHRRIPIPCLGRPDHAILSGWSQWYLAEAW